MGQVSAGVAGDYREQKLSEVREMQKDADPDLSAFMHKPFIFCKEKKKNV